MGNPQEPVQGDPLRELHTTLLGAGLLGGEDSDFGRFQEGMRDAEDRRGLYEHIKATRPEMVGAMDVATFDTRFAPPPIEGSKKKAPGDGSTASSPASVPTAAQQFNDPFGRNTNGPTVQPQPSAGPASTTNPLDPFQRIQEGPEILPVDAQAPPFQLNGSEDPLEVGGKFRRLIEKDYDAMEGRADKYTWRKGERDLEKIALYGQEALKQSQAGSQLMARRLGKDWEKEFAKYAEIVQPMMNGASPAETPADAAYYQEAMEFYSQVKAEPSFQMWADGQAALAKAQAAFNEYGKKNPKYAQQLAEQKALEMQADAQPGFAFQNWTGKKATQIVAGIASLPRTLFGIPQSPGLRTDVLAKTPLYDLAQGLGDWADNAVEWATRVSPTGSGTERALWEKVAPFEGVDVVVDDKGVVTGAFKDNVAVEVDNDFVRRFAQSGAGQQAENKFTGVGNTAFKLVDVVADLYLMRTMGGGTFAGTSAAAFSLQHQDAYTTALKDLKLTGDDAETYAMVSAGLSAVIEASIGKIELGPLKLQAAKSLGLKEARALVGKATPYDIAKASMMPLLREIGMENVEELTDTATQALNNQVFNALTGSALDASIKPEQIAETILLTTLTTGGVSGVDAVRTGRGQMHTLALNAAVQNPEAFNTVLDELRKNEVIDEGDAQMHRDRIQYLAALDKRLPESLTQEQRHEVINLEDMRFLVNGQATNAPTEGLREAHKKTLKSLDTKISGILTKPAEDATPVAEEIAMPPETNAPAPVVPVEKDVVIADTVPVATTEAPPLAVEPATPTGDTSPAEDIFNAGRGQDAGEVTPFDMAPPTADRLGENRLVPMDQRADAPVLTDLLPDRNTTVGQVAQAYQNPEHGDAFLDDLTNLAVNSLQPKQARALGDQVVPLRDFLTDHFQDEAWVQSVSGQPFQRTVENLTNEYVRENTSDVPTPERALSKRLNPVTAQDYIAKVFAEGVKVRLGAMGSDVTELNSKGATRIQYTGKGDNGVPLDLLAMDILDAMGQDGQSMAAVDMQNAITAFINENPNGPGDYLRKTVAERERIDRGMDEEMARLDYSPQETQAAMEAAVGLESNMTEAQAAEVDAFMQAYTGENGDVDVERLLEEWSAWDPFDNPTSPISQLSQSTYNLLNEQINAVRTNEVADQTVRSAETQNPQEASQPVESSPDGDAIDPAGSQKTPDTQPEPGRILKNVDLAISMGGDLEQMMADVEEQLATIELPDALTPELVRELRVEGYLDATEHAAALAFIDGDDSAAGWSVYDKAMAALPNLRQVNSQGPDTSARLEEDGIERMPTPVLSVMADGSQLVENAVAFADLLSQAGGKYDVPLGGWLLPAETNVQAILGSRPTDGKNVIASLDKSHGDTGMFGAVKNLLTSPGALVKANRTRAKLAAAKTLDERLAVAMEQHRIDRGKDTAVVRRTLNRLSKAFPGITMVTDVATIDQVKKELNLTGDVLGFEYQGKVYVDPRVARPTTPIHEFGHIWNNWMKANDPAMYEQGAALARASDTFALVQSTPAYANMSEAEQIDEVLATAIGERGALMGDTDIVLSFRNWLQGMWSAAGPFFGRNPQFMTLREFADHQATRMLGGRPLMRETSDRIAELNGGIEVLRAQYGGEKGAKGAVLANLDVAWEMEEQGVDDKKIFHATGWYRGVDGNWRWVIDSTSMRIRIGDGETSVGMNLPDVIDYPALFEAYPAMKNVLVFFDPTRQIGTAGTGLALGGVHSITMSPDNIGLAVAKTLFVHEIQHIIQRMEGFAVGSSSQMMERVLRMEIMDMVDDEMMVNLRDQKAVAVLQARRERLDRYTRYPNAGSAAYRDVAGEVEARAAEKNLVQQSRSKKQPVFPPSLYDVAPEDQIVLFENNGQVNLAPPRLQVDMNAADYQARVDTARQVVALEIKDNGLRTLEQASRRIAGDLNLDLLHVKRLYEQEVASKMGKLVLTTSDLNMPEETQKEKLLRHYSIKSGKARAWMKKKFSTIKNLPREIFDLDEKRLGKVAARLKEGEWLVADLERAMKAAYKKPNDAHWQHVDNVMTGQGDWKTLPPEVRAAAQEIRRFMDTLSRDLVRSGVMNGEVILTVLNNAGLEITQDELEGYGGVNAYEALGKLPFERSQDENDAIESLLNSQTNTLGNYFYRSYRKYDDPEGWKDRVTPRVKNEARRLLQGNIQREIDKLEQARTDKYEALQEKIDTIQDEINAIVDGIEAQISALEQRKVDLSEKQKQAVAGGKRNKTFDRSYAAADKALRALNKRAKEARTMALADAEDLLDLEGVAEGMGGDGDYQNLSVAAKQIVKKRRTITDLRDRQEATQTFRQSALDSMLNHQQNIDGLIGEILYVETGNPASQLSRSMLGGKDMKILKTRKEIAPEIRELMGEYHDPRINFAKSMYRAVNLLENQIFLTHLREQFAGEYFIPPEQVKEGFVPISSKGSQTMSPLNGWKAPEEIVKVLNSYFSPSGRADTAAAQIFENYMKFTAAVKYGKTILSPVTHFRNFVGNFYFVINNAYNPLSKKPFLAFRDAWTNTLNQDQKAYLLEMTELRVLGNGTYIGDLKELMGTLNADSAEAFFQNRINDGIMRLNKGIQDTYGAEDDFFRIMAFETEKKRYAKRLYGRKFELLTPAEQRAVKEKAAQIVIDTMPTYSRVPEIVKDIQKFPLTGTFVAFPAEIVRTTINQYKLIASDLKDPRTRTLGFQRMAGAAVVQGALTAGLTALGHFLTGIDWEEDEAMRKMMLPWQQKGVHFYTDFKPGEEFRFVNTSYTNPYNVFTKPVVAMMFNYEKSGVERTQEALWSLFEPYLSPELTAATLGGLYYNRDLRNDKPIYNEEIGYWKDRKKIINYLKWSLQQGVVKTAQDFYSAATGEGIGGRSPKRMNDVLMGFMGLQVERVNIEKAVASDIFKLSQRLKNAKMGFTSERALHKDDKEYLNDRYDVVAGAYNEVLEDTGESLRAASLLGLNVGKQRQLLKQYSFSERERQAIVSKRRILPKFEDFKRSK